MLNMLDCSLLVHGSQPGLAIQLNHCRDSIAILYVYFNQLIYLHQTIIIIIIII